VMAYHGLLIAVTSPVPMDIIPFNKKIPMNTTATSNHIENIQINVQCIERNINFFKYLNIHHDPSCKFCLVLVVELEFWSTRGKIER
jgi:hypothetical protein